MIKLSHPAATTSTTSTTSTTTRPEDQGTRGPEDRRTGGPGDQRTGGPGDQGTKKKRGPEDQKKKKCPKKKEKNSQNKSAPSINLVCSNDSHSGVNPIRQQALSPWLFESSKKRRCWQRGWRCQRWQVTPSWKMLAGSNILLEFFF